MKEAHASSPSPEGEGWGGGEGTPHSAQIHQPIAVIGAGSWGTTLAQLLAEKGKDVRLWVREPDVCEGLQPGSDQPYLSPGDTALFPAHLHPGTPGGPGRRRAGPDGGPLPRVPPDLARPQAALPPEGGAAQRHQGHGDRLPPHHGGSGPGGNGGGNPLCGAGRPQLRPGSGPEAAHRGDHRLPAAGDAPTSSSDSFPPLISGCTPPTMSPGWSWGGP